MTILNLELIKKASHILGLLSLVILMSDEILDTCIWSVHIIVEFIEYSAEMTTVSILNTNDKQTEIIGFYLILATSLYVAYRLSRTLRSYYIQFITRLEIAWLNRNKYSFVRWYMLSIIGKIELVTVCIISSIPFWFLI